jgi:hypothetical protein
MSGPNSSNCIAVSSHVSVSPWQYTVNRVVSAQKLGSLTTLSTGFSQMAQRMTMHLRSSALT